MHTDEEIRKAADRILGKSAANNLKGNMENNVYRGVTLGVRLMLEEILGKENADPWYK